MLQVGDKFEGLYDFEFMEFQVTDNSSFHDDDEYTCVCTASPMDEEYVGDQYTLDSTDVGDRIGNDRVTAKTVSYSYEAMDYSVATPASTSVMKRAIILGLIK